MVSFTAERRRHTRRNRTGCRICACRQRAQERARIHPAPAGTAHAVAAEHGMVVAQEKIGARIGADILRQGGNAVDAAVATGFALAVTYPRAGNIGGGGFMIIHSAERSEDVAIDYRETAPAAATRDMFLGADGKPDIAKSRDSALSIGVPGTVAGLALALEKYGSGQVHAGGPAQAVHRAGARRLCHRRRHGRHAARHCATAGALAGLGEDIFPRRRQLAAGRRHAGADRSGGDARRRSRRRDRAAFTRARSRKNWRPGFATPAAS